MSEALQGRLRYIFFFPFFLGKLCKRQNCVLELVPNVFVVTFERVNVEVAFFLSRRFLPAARPWPKFSRFSWNFALCIELLCGRLERTYCAVLRHDNTLLFSKKYGNMP